MDHITELLTRGVDTIYPSKTALEEVLRSGKKLTLYQGFDPTGDKLHIGHMVGLMKLADWQKLGHHVIFLIGDFTGMIGDPSGKTISRPMLSKDKVIENAKSYKEQAGKILDFDGENRVEIKYNSEWLGKISAIEFLQIAGRLSVQQVVERDLFQERKKSGEDIYMNEFLYPIMQAYDSVAMNVDLEIGGTDQMFNMLMGRKLMRHMLQKDKFVMTTPLLTDAAGNKIGKTEGNVIALTDTPQELFGKIMAFPDEIIIPAFTYLTRVPMEEIEKAKQALATGENPVNYKKRLAFEMVKLLNDEASADRAQEHFAHTIQQGNLPTEIQEITISADDEEMVNEDLLVDLNLAASKSEAKRLFQQGGVEVDGERVSDSQQGKPIQDGTIIKIGKRRVVRLKLDR